MTGVQDRFSSFFRRGQNAAPAGDGNSMTNAEINILEGGPDSLPPPPQPLADPGVSHDLPFTAG